MKLVKFDSYPFIHLSPASSRLSLQASSRYCIYMSVEEYIGTTLYVDLVDGRKLDGVLTVIDPFGNLLISNTWETSVDRLNSSLERRRELGLVSVPKAQIGKLWLMPEQVPK